MDAQQVAEFLQEQVELALEDDDAPGVRRMETFEEAGVLTSDAGFVISLDDGTQHQVTVVRSR